MAGHLPKEWADAGEIAERDSGRGRKTAAMTTDSAGIRQGFGAARAQNHARACDNHVNEAKWEAVRAVSSASGG
jgi:hypothetical protein